MDFDQTECQAAVLGLYLISNGETLILFELVKTSYKPCFRGKTRLLTMYKIKCRRLEQSKTPRGDHVVKGTWTGKTEVGLEGKKYTNW